MRSSIFLNEISVIDHAYIDNTGKIIGGSFLCSFVVSGETDPKENVVVDFSTIKKDIKKIIDCHSTDQKMNGFDHNLWLIEGYSKYVTYTDRSKFGNINITTPACTISVPSDYIKAFEANTYSKQSIGSIIGKHVENLLSIKYSDINITVYCKLTEIAVMPMFENELFKNEYFMFRYTHGLKNSTSYGCRNIAHGHLSYLYATEISDEISEVLDIIHKDLKNAVFINKENIINETDTEIEVYYIIDDNYKFYASYDKNINNLIVLETETTIEFLAEYIKTKYNLNVPFYVSEGLNKGAFIN
jgi:hypothetical protein